MPRHAKNTHFIQKFVVRGKLPFPLDMLRYDAAFPRDSDDAIAISTSFDPLSGSVTVTLNRAALPYSYPTFRRWESFGWEVISVDDKVRVAPLPGLRGFE